MRAQVARDPPPPETADLTAIANNLIEAFWTEALLTARLAMAEPDSRERAAIQSELDLCRAQIDELESEADELESEAD
jgi:hypothetical protein